MRNFANGYGEVTVFPKPSGEARLLDLLGANEQSVVVGWSVFSGQKSVAGSATGGSLDIMTMEGTALSGEFVDVRGLYVACAEAL
jgi:hypothetical protein